jgi:hypothetical protein
MDETIGRCCDIDHNPCTLYVFSVHVLLYQILFSVYHIMSYKSRKEGR